MESSRLNITGWNPKPKYNSGQIWSDRRWFGYGLGQSCDFGWKMLMKGWKHRVDRELSHSCSGPLDVHRCWYDRVGTEGGQPDQPSVTWWAWRWDAHIGASLGMKDPLHSWIVQGSSVTSHNIHMTFADNTWLVPSCCNHPCHPHATPKIPELHFHTQTRSHHLLTLDSTFSLSLVYCSSLTLPTCASHSCIHCLAVFPLTLPISPPSHLPHFWYSD